MSTSPDHDIMDDIINAFDARDFAQVKRLIKSEPEIARREIPGSETLLHSAAYSGQKDMARLLLDLGANINARNRALQTPLYLAMENRHTSMVAFLLDRGADMHLPDSGSMTPFYWAASGADADAVRKRIFNLFLKHGAKIDVNAAVLLEDDKYLKAQLAKDPDALKKCRFPTILLESAIDKGSWYILNFLLEHGLDPNKGRVGCPPLMVAVGRDADLVELLLQFGAHPNCKFANGKTALQYAKEFEAKRMVAMLRKAGAK